MKISSKNLVTFRFLEKKGIIGKSRTFGEIKILEKIDLKKAFFLQKKKLKKKNQKIRVRI